MRGFHHEAAQPSLSWDIWADESFLLLSQRPSSLSLCRGVLASTVVDFYALGWVGGYEFLLCQRVRVLLLQCPRWFLSTPGRMELWKLAFIQLHLSPQAWPVIAQVCVCLMVPSGSGRENLTSCSRARLGGQVQLPSPVYKHWKANRWQPPAFLSAFPVLP